MKSKRNIRAVNKTYLQHSKAGSHTSYRHELVEYLHSMRWDTRSIETSSHEEGDINILGLCIDHQGLCTIRFSWSKRTMLFAFLCCSVSRLGDAY